MVRTTTLPPFFAKPPAPGLRLQEANAAQTCLKSEPNGPKPIPRFITTQQLVADTLKLVGVLPPNLSAVIGVARSGMISASVLATTLHLPLYALDQERGIVRSVGHGWRMRDHKRTTGPVLVIDDTTGSGRSLRMTRRALAQCHACQLHGVEKILASVYCNPESETKPDLWSAELPLPHLLEWNFMNSIVTSVAAFDFDGILCHDAESGGEIGAPLYLPRREPIHIITGRREVHRDVTLAWLQKWSVRVASLTMMADDDEREIAEYKAEAVQKFAATANERPFGSAMFVESCREQARRIAELSAVLTICPRTREVLCPQGGWL